MGDVLVEMFKEERIIVRCDYIDYKRVRETIGGRFVGPEHGGPGLSFVLEMETCRKIRSKIEDAIFSEELLDWGRKVRDEQVSLVELAAEQDVDLKIVPVRIPEMGEKLRDYQRVGIKFISECPNPLIADQPGLGKTWQVIGGVYESGLADGPNLVVCPKIAIEDVWLKELHRFQENPVFVAPEGAKQRDRLLDEVEMCLEIDQPFWLVVNPHMLTFRKTADGDPRGTYDSVSGEYFRTQFPFLMRTVWNSVIVDEAHDTGLANPGTNTARAMAALQGRKRIAMTGTPAGGKPLRYWGMLHWLEPHQFRSKWQWQDRWLKTEKRINKSTGAKYTVVSGFESEAMEKKFFEEHGHYILRRTKSEVAPDLPDKNYIDIWVNMTDDQRAQYETMEDEAEARLYQEEVEVGRLSSPNVLTTNTWLKQFSFGLCEIYEKGKVLDVQLEEFVMKYGARAMARDANGDHTSPKLEALYERIMKPMGMEDGESGGKLIVFSQFKHVVDTVTEDLKAHGFKADKITGGTAKREYRQAVMEAFQNGDLQIVVISMKAGGTAITLDAADDVVFLDEDFNPDVMEQCEDRAHRISRIHKVNVWKIRTNGSVDIEIQRAVNEKREINDVLLDRYRRRRENQEETEWE
jgi:SNF2 family DNA or RNA helicase